MTLLDCISSTPEAVLRESLPYRNHTLESIMFEAIKSKLAEDNVRIDDLRRCL